MYTLLITHSRKYIWWEVKKFFKIIGFETVSPIAKMTEFFYLSRTRFLFFARMKEVLK